MGKPFLWSGLHLRKTDDLMIVTNTNQPFEIYGGRDTPWGNYATYGNCRAETLRNHWLWLSPATIDAARVELVGKRVGCWCTPKQCHLENIAHHLGGRVERSIKNTVFGLVVSRKLTQQDFKPGLVTVISGWDTAEFQVDSQLMPVFWDGDRPKGMKGVLVK